MYKLEPSINQYKSKQNTQVWCKRKSWGRISDVCFWKRHWDPPAILQMLPFLQAGGLTSGHWASLVLRAGEVCETDAGGGRPVLLLAGFSCPTSPPGPFYSFSPMPSLFIGFLKDAPQVAWLAQPLAQHAALQRRPSPVEGVCLEPHVQSCTEDLVQFLYSPVFPMPFRKTTSCRSWCLQEMEALCTAQHSAACIMLNKSITAPPLLRVTVAALLWRL